jgi:hypothetical protein
MLKDMKRPTPAMFIALVALFFSIGGAGLAASRYLITSTHQIAPAVLKHLEKPGLRGLTGAQGATGSAGVMGAPGASAVPEYTDAVSGNDTSVIAGATIIVAVFCPPGTQAEGGGYRASGMTVDANIPDAPNGWQITVTNQTGGTLQATPWVTCRGTAAALAS